MGTASRTSTSRSVQLMDRIAFRLCNAEEPAITLAQEILEMVATEMDRMDESWRPRAIARWLRGMEG